MAESERSATLFTNGLYDKLKFVAQILLPALATLWFAVGTTWDLPHTTQVVGTITAFDTFLGLVLQLSTKLYYKTGANFDGDLIVTPEDGGNKVSLAFNHPPEDIVDRPGKHSLELKVLRHSDQRVS
jgi:hypothetical protein